MKHVMYYQEQLERPLDEFLTADEDSEALLTIRVHCNGYSSNELAINLESIKDIREMLDLVESKLTGGY
jgi:hypothetical protein